jgi:hypothetical protein
LRKLLPAHDEEVSDFENPLTQDELATMTAPFHVEGLRYFRLPIVPLMNMVLPSDIRSLWKTDYHLLKRYPALERYATAVVMRLIK